MNTATKSRMPLAIIALGLTIPTLITWIYFDLLASAPALAQKSAYALGKLSQVGIMLIAFWIWRQRPKLSNEATLRINKPISMSWIGLGCVSGLVIGILAIAIFQWVLLPMGVMNSAKESAQEKLRILGADSPIVLLAIALFYALIHSGFEEFYWRGFVFRGLREHLGDTASICISSLGFMSHHVLVLGKLFGYGTTMTFLLALCVAVGGMIWAVFYQRCGSLIPGWISHAVVDAAIFVVAYRLVFIS